MSVSLFTIEESLAMLVEAREAAEAEGDAASITECDKAIAEYLDKSAAKVDSYAALIRRQTAEAEECVAEAARLMARAKQRRAFVDRLKATALEVMQRFGVKELRSAQNTLRVQKNGGLQSLEVDPTVELPEGLQYVTVTMPGRLWKEIARSFDITADTKSVRIIHQSDGAEIRKALAEKVPCPECKGIGQLHKCERCEDTGLVPRTISGARLLPRQSHVRVE